MMSVPVIYFDLGNTLVFLSGGSIQPYPDAVDTIDELWRRGYRIGLLSDQAPGKTIPQVVQDLDDFGLDSSRFDVITISSEFNPPIPKPEKEIFDAALAKAGHAAASSDTVFITETLQHILDARSFGWRAIHKPHQSACTAASGECIENLDELLDLFPELPVDLHIRDAADDPGSDLYTGPVFWNSPDLWIRNSDDGGLTHEPTVENSDNWFYCRVHNRGVGIARQFYVIFKIQEWAGTQFVYAGDYFPYTALASGLGIDPGESQVVSKRWMAVDVPSAGTHACWLAAAWISGDPPLPGAHPWQDNNLAQKNLAIIEQAAGETAELLVFLGSRLIRNKRFQRLELHRSANALELHIALEGKSPDAMSSLVRLGRQLADFPQRRVTGTQEVSMRFLDPVRVELARAAAGEGVLTMELESGSLLRMNDPTLPVRPEIERRPPRAEPAKLVRNERGYSAIAFANSRISAIGIGFRPLQRVRSMLRVALPKSAKHGDSYELNLLQRAADGRIEGGVTLQINIEG